MCHCFACLLTDQEVRATADVDRRIPELKEVFERFPSVPVNIDIKYDSDKLISEVIRTSRIGHHPL